MTCLVIALLAPTESLAQDNYAITGLVKEAKTGETLPHANIRIVGTTMGTATNVDGHFTLLDVPAGLHQLEITFIGYLSSLIDIDPAEFEGLLVVELSPLTTKLGGIVVTAENYTIMKAAGAVSQITLSPRDLAVLPNVGEVDIFRSLQLLPGISGTNEGSAGLFVRGGTPDQNLVLLDGMTVYHVDHFFGFFSAFNADAIKDVQVYKGGFPAKYGGRTSSVVDLAGKTGDVNNLNGAMGLNLLSGNGVLEIPLKGRGSVLISARRSYTDIIQSGLYTSIYETITGDDITPDTDTQNAQGGGRRGGGGGALGGGFRGPNEAFVQPDFYFYDLNIKGTFRPSDYDVLSLSFYNGEDNLDKSRDQLRDIALPNNNSTSIRNDVIDLTNWGNVGVSGKWSRQWSPRFYSNSLIAYSRYFSDYDRDTLIERLDAEADSVSFSRNFGTVEKNRLQDFSVRLDNEWKLNANNLFAFGAQLTRADVTYENVRDDTLSVLQRDQASTQIAVYAQNTWDYKDRVELTAGVRGVHYNATSSFYIEPRLSVMARLTDRVSVKAAAGVYNQFVARVVNENVTEGARDFWLLADGETVRVNGATHLIAGASYETANWLFDTEVFYKDITDLTEFSLRFQREANFGPGGANLVADELFFTGDGTAKGLEVLLQKKRGRLTGWLSYTLSNVEHVFPELNDGEGFPALHDQEHELKLVNSLRLGRWNIAATWTFGTGKPYTAPISEYSITLLDGSELSYIHVGGKNSERLPAYHRLDTSVHYKTHVRGTGLDVGFSIFNLYNRSNVWYREFDLSESPMVTTDITFLGITPNLSIRLDF